MLLKAVEVKEDETHVDGDCDSPIGCGECLGPRANNGSALYAATDGGRPTRFDRYLGSRELGRLEYRGPLAEPWSPWRVWCRRGRYAAVPARRAGQENREFRKACDGGPRGQLLPARSGALDLPAVPDRNRAVTVPVADLRLESDRYA